MVALASVHDLEKDDAADKAAAIGVGYCVNVAQADNGMANVRRGRAG